MKNIEFSDLKEKIKKYPKEEIEQIEKAYNYAKTLHANQYRQSGEEYITHPLQVANILAQMHADCDTICAGLLHDTLEDTKISSSDIALNFNQDVSILVEGVTKLAKMNFSTKQDQNYANTRKIITGITTDVRIIIIKLIDRLHNMRTLQYKTPFKQIENSLETLQIFVPLAYYIGAYRIKTELEDLSLQYLKPDTYQKILEKKLKIEEESMPCLEEMKAKISTILLEKEIPNEIKIRTKTIYGIYHRLTTGHQFLDIHDLFALKIMVDEIENCYRTLGFVHSNYHPINNKFKDYICNPKTNMYSSLHTTVFGPDERLVQTQIRTFNMDKFASFGLTAYWEINRNNAKNIMQKQLKEKYQFFKSLVEINETFRDNQEFIEKIKNELFSNNVYVYTTKGEVIELPEGSTIIDFAYKISPNMARKMVSALVNDKEVSLDYILKNKDRIKIITNDLSYGPKNDWVQKAQTSYAKKKIKELI